MPPLECIVVDDGSTRPPAEICHDHGATLLRTGSRSGSARARNLGAASARGEIILFLDADVCPHPDTLERVQTTLRREPDVVALSGAYDDAPAESNFFSQYRNLLHTYVHRTARREASTFWSGCGAIRNSVFQAFGGFDEAYSRPSIEDIELGYRLRLAGYRLLFDPQIQVTHLKRWTFWSMVKTDIFDRGIPWTGLILRDRSMPDDLNLRREQRLSVALMLLLAALLFTWGAAALAGVDRLTGAHGYLGAAALVMTGAVVTLNAGFYRFLSRVRGPAFALAAIPPHLLFHFYSGISFIAGAVRFAFGSPAAAK